MPGLHQGSLDGYAALELEEEDARDGLSGLAVCKQSSSEERESIVGPGNSSSLKRNTMRNDKMAASGFIGNFCMLLLLTFSAAASVRAQDAGEKERKADNEVDLIWGVKI